MVRTMAQTASTGAYQVQAMREQLAQLNAAGVLTAGEFAATKAKVLASQAMRLPVPQVTGLERQNHGGT
jgi:hypothetical protein